MRGQPSRLFPYLFPYRSRLAMEDKQQRACHENRGINSGCDSNEKREDKIAKGKGPHEIKSQKNKDESKRSID